MATNPTFKPQNYTLDKDHQFDGTNFARFSAAFKFSLRGNGLIYLIQKDSSGSPKEGPPGSNRIFDSGMLFEALRLNIHEEAWGHIEPFEEDGDGVGAWESFVANFDKRDVGSAMALLAIKRGLVWDGVDEKSFDNFVSQFLEITTKLKATGFKHTDHTLAQELMERVPTEYLTQVYNIILDDPNKLTFNAVRDLIKTNIRLHQTKATAAAFLVQGGVKKNAKPNWRDNKPKDFKDTRRKVTTPCGICKLLKVEDEKAMHPEANCWNAKRFPDHIRELRQAQGSRVKQDLAEEMANLAVSNDSSTEQEACYMAVETVGVRALTKTDWVVDTGCTVSMTPFPHLLENYSSITGTVAVGNKERMQVSGRGELAFRGEDMNMYRIMHVLHVPDLALNLLATRPFTKKGGHFGVRGMSAALSSPAGTTILNAQYETDNLLHCSITPTRGLSLPPSTETCLLTTAAISHRRFGHVSTGKMGGMPDSRDDRCEACVTGKFKRVAFNGSRPEITTPLEEISVDLFGKTRVPTAAGAFYMLVITDTATSYTCVHFLKTKNEASAHLKEYKQLMERQTPYVIQNIRSDGGGEFINNDLERWRKETGIAAAVNAPYSSNQNPYAEGRIGTIISDTRTLSIISDTRTLLIDSGVPTSLWGYAAAHSVYIRNRMPSRNGRSPHALMFGKEPRIDHLRPFGCASFAWIPPRYREEGKLNPRAEKCILLGFESGTSNARLYHVEQDRYFSSRDVRYFEDVFPCKGDKIPDLSFLKTQWETTSDSVGVMQKRQKQTRVDNDSDDEDDQEILPDRAPTLSPPPDDRHQRRSITLSRSPVVTRAATRAQQMRQRAEQLRAARQSLPESEEESDDDQNVPPGTLIHDVPFAKNESDTSDDEMAIGLLAVLDVPASMKEALEGPDREEWEKSLQSELDSIEQAGTWELVNIKDLPEGTRPIDSRLVLNVKLDPTGNNNHIAKTRLVAKGFSQRPGIDFYDTYSPVGHRQSFRHMMSIVAREDWEMQGLDIRGAYLHGDLEEVIFMRLPNEITGGRKQVAKLKRALYGLKQAGRCWNDKIDGWLTQQGWTSSSEDSCIYVRRKPDGVVDMLLYIHVDDSVVAGPNLAEIEAFIDYLDQYFPLKRQPIFRHMIGLEVTRDRRARCIWITQAQYVSKILREFDLLECKPNQLPIRPSAAQTLCKATETEIRGAKDLPYRELLGCLQYLSTMSRPDICFAVNRLSAYCSAWSAKHFELAKGILRYVSGTKDWGLHLGRTTETLVGFSDSDFNANLDDRKSTTGWLVQYRGGTIGWRSRKQARVAHSTAEAEYVAADDAARDLVWERRALSVLGDKEIQQSATILNIDNKAAIHMSKNRTNHESTKHIDSRYHYIRDLVSTNVITTQYISTDINHADILTKALPRESFLLHVAGMGIGPVVIAPKWEKEKESVVARHRD